jgi:hypothetical protein
MNSQERFGCREELPDPDEVEVASEMYKNSNAIGIEIWAGCLEKWRVLPGFKGKLPQK